MARLLVDANLAPAIASALRLVGHDAVHVADLGLLTAGDSAILGEAIASRRWIVTFDLDFVHLLATRSLTQPSLVLLRTRSAHSSVVTPRLVTALRKEAAALARGAIVVVDERSLRVRRLPIGSGD